MSTTKSSRPQTIKISLTSSEMKQFRVVKELKPEWNEQQCVDYCKDRNWDPTEIQSSLQAAFEFDRESQEEWHEVSKKQPASVAAKTTVERGASSTRGRSSERGGFSARGRGRARSAGANRGSRDVTASEESKSGTDEKTVEETKPVEKRPFPSKRPMKKESKPALATPVPGKSYSAALLAKLPQPAPVQNTPPPANVAPKTVPVAAPTQSSPVDHSKVESKSDHSETKSELVHQVLPTPTPNVSFAAALASGGQATKWKKKETKKQEIESVHHPETTEQIEPAKVEEPVQIIAEAAKEEEKPLEQESHQETHQLAVPASPARSPQPTPHHEEVIAAVHKSPSHSPLPKSPISKSPLSKSVHAHAHPSPSHAPLPPPHNAPAPLPISAPVIVEPLSGLLSATETVILPSHLQAAVSASAPSVQFGSFGKASGPRAPQPAPVSQPAPVTVTPPVSVPQTVPVAVAAPAPATTFAPSTSISSHQTRFPSPASALGGILPSAVSTQTDNSKTIGQFPTRVEAATETANAPSNDYEQSLPTEEQAPPTASPQQSYASDASEHNLYSSNFNQLNQSAQANAGQADAYASQAQSSNYEQTSDPYSSMYQGESQYSMYQGDQSSFYGNAMRQQNKPDMNKNQQNKNQAANKFNNPAAGVVGPANQQQRQQPQNKPPRQQQTQQGPFGAQDQYNKGNNQRYPNQQQQAYGNPNVNQYANKHPQSPSHPQQSYGQPKGAVGSQQQGGYKGGFNKQNVPMNQQQVGQFGVGGHPYQIAQQPMSYNSVYGYPSGYMTPQYYPSAQYPNFAPRGPYGYPYSTFSPYGHQPMTQTFETDYQSDYSKQMYSSQPPNNQPAVGQQGGDMSGQGSVQPTDNGATGYGADPSSWQQMKPQPKPSDSQQYPTGYAMQPQFQPAGPVHHQPSMHTSQQPHTHAPVAGPSSYQQPMGSYQPHVPGLQVHPDQARYQNTQWSQ